VHRMPVACGAGREAGHGPMRVLSFGSPSGRRDQMTFCIGRREFITLLGGAVAATPLAARAQPGERMRRVGVLLGFAADDPEGQTRLAAFAEGLEQLGWTFGGNVRIAARAQAMPTTRANTRRNWPRSRRTSSSPLAAQPWRHCCRRRAPCRSCSRSSPIRSGAIPGWRSCWRGHDRRFHAIVLPLCGFLQLQLGQPRQPKYSTAASVEI
jgi:hypothetical protein